MPAPRVWPWYLAFCVTMMLMYLLVTAGGLALIGGLASGFFDQVEAPDRVMLTVSGPLYTVLGTVFALLYAMPLVLGRSPSGWYMGFGAISLALLSPCTALFAVPLLIGWLDSRNIPGLRGDPVP